MPKLLDFTMAIAPELTNFIQRYINISHPWPKQDVVALPHFDQGEMANFGLVMFDEEYIPPDEFQSATKIAGAVARGMVHHWFGGLVTQKWWSDYWFNECLVTYISVIVVKYTFIEWDLTSSMMNVYEFDSLESAKPVSFIRLLYKGNPSFYTTSNIIKVFHWDLYYFTKLKSEL